MRTMAVITMCTERVNQFPILHKKKTVRHIVDRKYVNIVVTNIVMTAVWKGLVFVTGSMFFYTELGVILINK